ncbi:MAG: synthase subunit delta [Myxococcaceae bacterium]|nr:synthase subunit delta [Myxococcaceae bacterium]
MSVGSLAKRYARAILELASEAGQTQVVGKELAEFVTQWNESDELRSIFLNPNVKLADRKAILAAVTEQAGLSQLTRNSILYINDQGRIGALPHIARSFAELAGEASGVVRAEVTSASPLSETYYAQLQKTLEQVTGHKVSIEKKLDPSLIAGVVTRVGDKVFDGSIRSRLADLKDTLRGV